MPSLRAFALAPVLWLAATLPVLAAPALSFTDHEVAVSGATAGGSVVFWSMAHEADGSFSAFVRRERIVADDDRDGSVMLALEAGVPPRSIWVAVDLASGAAAVATPDGYPLREMELPGRSIRRALQGAVHALESERQWIEVLLVRPGVGAWTFTLGDGGESDADGTYDGLGRMALDRMVPLGEGAPAAPARFRKGDLLFAIDPDRMEIWSNLVVEEVAP